METKRALIVDDSESIGEIISYMLKKIDVESVVVKNGADAINFINSPAMVDLFIVDYFLSDGTSGFISKAIRESKERASIPVITITGGGEDLTLKILESGSNIVLHKPLEEKEFLMIAKNLMALSDAYRKLDDIAQIVGSLVSAIEVRDNYTSGHSRRVANLALDIFREMGFNEEREESSLYYGALLHDVGKIGIPDEILNAERKLSDEEFDLIKTHPRLGHDICSNLNKLRSTLNIILQHHERIDGSGYPDGIKNSDLSSQITQVADIYDAMTTERSYRKAMSHEVAVALMKQEADSGRLNSKIVEALVSLSQQHDFSKKLDRQDPYLLR